MSWQPRPGWGVIHLLHVDLLCFPCLTSIIPTECERAVTSPEQRSRSKVIYLPQTPSLYVHQVRRSLTPVYNRMTLISNDPSWWPSINASHIASCFGVASSAVLMYDWGEQYSITEQLISL
ncbi:hypothetical protein EV424DRAFT_1419809 [Suillus variegatus]|nr:hypothetical protein EV424DRAFT_1419809 [Suillus variegatus]